MSLGHNKLTDCGRLTDACGFTETTKHQQQQENKQTNKQKQHEKRKQIKINTKEPVKLESDCNDFRPSKAFENISRFV